MSGKNDSSVPFGILNQSHEVLKRVANGSLEADAVKDVLQSLIEGKPFGQSSRDERIVAEYEEVGLSSAYFDVTIIWMGQKLKRHLNGGGWVPFDQSEEDLSKPFVAESAYVGPFALVSGNARVLDNARISGNAQIFDNARVLDDALIFGNARIYGKARISGDAQVVGIVTDTVQ